MRARMRPLIAIVVPLTALVATALPAAAISVTVNGRSVTFEPPPIARVGRVFVPLRGVFERLGASVVYERGAINATGNNHAISLHIGSTQATIDGQPKFVDVAPFVIGASTYVPLRFVSQALGADVNYDAQNAIVALNIAIRGQTPVPLPPPAVRALLQNIQPARGSVVRSTKPTISADFKRDADPNSVRIALDGADVTSGATRSRSGFVYAPPSPLQSMKHTLRATGTLLSGEPFTDMWSFTSGTEAAENSLTISSPANGSTVDTTFDVTGKTAPNARVRIVAGATATVGGVFAFGAGSFAGNVKAGPRGNFTQTVTLRTVPGAEIGLTITSTDPESNESAQKKLRLRAQ